MNNKPIVRPWSAWEYDIDSVDSTEFMFNHLCSGCVVFCFNDKGRCPIVHLKDYNGKEKGNGFSYKSAGSGVVDIKGVIEAAKAADTEWLIVEQDDPEEGKTPMQCAEESAIYVLKNI